MLFVSSKVSQLALLPQGRPEAAKRAKAMIAKMEELGFGNCTNNANRANYRRQSSHRIHRTHRIFWRKIFSHGFHGCAQIRRVFQQEISVRI